MIINKHIKYGRYFKSFKRSFRLTSVVGTNKIKAKIEAGVLSVSVQKLEDDNSKEKSIEIK